MKNFAALVISVSLFGPLSDNFNSKTIESKKNTCMISTSAFKYINQLMPPENISYIYDHLGRIILLRSSAFKRTYTYSANEIIEKYENVTGRKNLTVVSHKLDAFGRIISSIEPSMHIKYSYSKNGYLCLAKFALYGDTSYRRESRYTIVDGNLQRIEMNKDGESDTVKVSSSTKSFPANFNCWIKDLPFEFTGPLRHYYGKPLKTLITKTETVGFSPVLYTYKKDILGNITQMKSIVTYEKTETDLIDIKYTCK